MKLKINDKERIGQGMWRYRKDLILNIWACISMPAPLYLHPGQPTKSNQHGEQNSGRKFYTQLPDTTLQLPSDPSCILYRWQGKKRGPVARRDRLVERLSESSSKECSSITIVPKQQQYPILTTPISLSLGTPQPRKKHWPTS